MLIAWIVALYSMNLSEFEFCPVFLHSILVYLSLSSPGWSARVLRLYWTVAARPDEAHHKLAVLDEVNVDGY